MKQKNNNTPPKKRDNMSKAEIDYLDKKYKTLWKKKPTNSFEDLKAFVQTLDEIIQDRLPELKQEVQDIIDSKNPDVIEIEEALDTLLVINRLGVGNGLFGKLLDYYKTINPRRALRYWDIHENDNMF